MSSQIFVGDVGGQEKIRRLWHHYYAGSDAVIFVIDANDPSRLDEAKKELYNVINSDELRDAALLVYANKQDLCRGGEICCGKLTLKVPQKVRLNLSSGCFINFFFIV